MPILKLKGGLGNQMFQYATGLAIHNKFEGTLSLDITGYDHESVKNSDEPREFKLNAFNISAGPASPEEILRNKYPLGLFSKAQRFLSQKIFRRFNQDYCPKYINKNHRYIEGYFQSEKNFLEVENKVRTEFTLINESGIFLKFKHQFQDMNSVAVHIRRGDYVTHKGANAHYGVLPKEYYNQAIDLIDNRITDCTFVFFSNDIDWVEKEFGTNPKFIYIKEKNLQDYEELILMSLCKHNIIANSSFSWWSAWLNKNPEKIVICPSNWSKMSPNPHPNITPESWIKI